MTLAFQHPPCPNSVLRRLDPRWKLAGILVAVGVTAALRSLPASLLALTAALLLAGLARLPLRWYLRRLAALLIVLLLFAAPLPFLLHGDDWTWEATGMHFSLHGARVALLLTAKAVALVTFVLVLLVTAPLDATLKAAHSLRVPGLLVQLVLLSYRYLFVLAGELAQLRIALRVRGFRNRASRHCYRTIGHVAGTLLVRSYERGERVGQAMRCRGFDGRFRSLTPFHTHAVDVAVFVLVVAAAAGIGWLDWRR